MRELACLFTFKKPRVFRLRLQQKPENRRFVSRIQHRIQRLKVTLHGSEEAFVHCGGEIGAFERCLCLWLAAFYMNGKTRLTCHDFVANLQVGLSDGSSVQTSSIAAL